MHFYPMANQFSFLWREAFRGLRADRFLSLTSVITIGVCSAVMSFLLLGLTLVFSLNKMGLGTEPPLRAFTRPEFEDNAGLASLRHKLEKLEAFDSVVFISKDDALGEFRHDLAMRCCNIWKSIRCRIPSPCILPKNLCPLRGLHS